MYLQIYVRNNRELFNAITIDTITIWRKKSPNHETEAGINWGYFFLSAINFLIGDTGHVYQIKCECWKPSETFYRLY